MSPRQRASWPRAGFAALAILGWNGPARAVVLLAENFDGLPLQASVSPTEIIAPAVWTNLPPADWIRDNRTTPVGDPVEFLGWTFVDKDWWIATANGGQGREMFTLGQGTVAVVDADEYADGTPIDPNLCNASLQTPVISLDGVPANSVVVSFVSSFRYEDSQEGRLEVSYDGGTTYFLLRAYLPSDPEALQGLAFINEDLRFELDNPSGGALLLRWSISNAGNDWWYAIDDLQISAAPEPAQPCLLAAGLAALAGARLSRQRPRRPLR